MKCYTFPSRFYSGARSAKKVREGGVVSAGDQTYVLEISDGHNNTLVVELSGDGNYWNINTAGIFKTSYGKNNKEVYNRHTKAKQSAETVEASQDAEQGGTQTSSSMNAPTLSDGKDTENSETESEKECIFYREYRGGEKHICIHTHVAYSFHPGTPFLGVRLLMHRPKQSYKNCSKSYSTNDR